MLGRVLRVIDRRYNVCVFLHTSLIKPYRHSEGAVVVQLLDEEVRHMLCRSTNRFLVHDCQHSSGDRASSRYFCIYINAQPQEGHGYGTFGKMQEEHDVAKHVARDPRKMLPIVSKKTNPHANRRSCPTIFLEHKSYPLGKRKDASNMGPIGRVRHVIIPPSLCP